MANAQTKASKKYHDSKGYGPRSYMVYKDVADRFKEVCQARGVSQAAAINAFMKKFIEDYENEVKASADSENPDSPLD